MKMLLTLVLTVAAAWSGYWYLGSTGVTTGFESWFEDRRSQGWAADYATLDVRGYPNRFDATFTDIDLADPATGLAWQTPLFQLLALSYRPSHVIAVWPDTQLVATPLQKYQLTSADMRASLVLEPTPALPLERTTLTAETLQVTPQGQNGTTGISALTLAAERIPAVGSPNYRLGLAADGFAPSLPWRKLVDPNGTLPDTLDALRADLTVEFDKPWDRSAIETARPQPRAIKVKLAEARWGQLQLQAAGEVTVDEVGIPKGEITIKARNWREILELAVNAGALPAGFAETLEDGLSLLAQLAGNPKTLDIPLNFANGYVKLGPVPIGPAPVLRLR